MSENAKNTTNLAEMVSELAKHDSRRRESTSLNDRPVLFEPGEVD